MPIRLIFLQTTSTTALTIAKCNIMIEIRKSRVDSSMLFSFKSNEEREHKNISERNITTVLNWNSFVLIYLIEIRILAFECIQCVL